jgi:hypothetical protein
MKPRTLTTLRRYANHNLSLLHLYLCYFLSDLTELTSRLSWLMAFCVILMNADTFSFLIIVFFSVYDFCFIPVYSIVLIPRAFYYFGLGCHIHFCVLLCCVVLMLTDSCLVFLFLLYIYSTIRICSQFLYPILWLDPCQYDVSQTVWFPAVYGSDTVRFVVSWLVGLCFWVMLRTSFRNFGWYPSCY